jgi:hypothetical protein
MEFTEGLNYSMYGTEIVKESNLIQRSWEAFTRGQRIRELREQGHPREEIISRGFTQEEYRKYNGKSIRQIGLEQASKTALIIGEFIG